MVQVYLQALPVMFFSHPPPSSHLPGWAALAPLVLLPLWPYIPMTRSGLEGNGGRWKLREELVLAGVAEPHALFMLGGTAVPT